MHAWSDPRVVGGGPESRQEGGTGEDHDRPGVRVPEWLALALEAWDACDPRRLSPRDLDEDVTARPWIRGPGLVY